MSRSINIKKQTNASGEATIQSSVEPPVTGEVQKKIKRKIQGADSEHAGDASTPNPNLQNIVLIKRISLSAQNLKILNLLGNIRISIQL